MSPAPRTQDQDVPIVMVIMDTMIFTTGIAEITERMPEEIAADTTEDHTDATPTSNQTMQRTAGSLGKEELRFMKDETVATRSPASRR